MTHSCVCLQNMFRRAPCVLDMWDMLISYVRHDSFICETCLIHMWHTSHSYVWHDPFTCGRQTDVRMRAVRLEMWDMTHSYVRHDSFICETWLMCHIWIRHVSHINESCLTYEISMSHRSPRHVRHDSFTREKRPTYTPDMTYSFLAHELSRWVL